MPVVHTTDVRILIKTAPPGAILREGRLKWRVIDGGNKNESRHQTFIIQATDECGSSVGLFSLTLNIIECGAVCGDNGECQVVTTEVDNDGPDITCLCHPGYHGMPTIEYH